MVVVFVGVVVFFVGMVVVFCCGSCYLLLWLLWVFIVEVCIF